MVPVLFHCDPGPLTSTILCNPLVEPPMNTFALVVTTPASSIVNAPVPLKPMWKLRLAVFKALPGPEIRTEPVAC